MLKKLHELGFRSEQAYTAGLLSIGLTVAVWITSLNAEPGTGMARADRWGIFIGEWAPTFFALGVGLSQFEQQEGNLGETGMQHMREMAKPQAA